MTLPTWPVGTRRLTEPVSITLVGSPGTSLGDEPLEAEPPDPDEPLDGAAAPVADP
jgi:hypothetical protein